MNAFSLNLINTLCNTILTSLDRQGLEDVYETEFVFSRLDINHIDHLVEEGFDLYQIGNWIDQGLRSITKEEAEERGFRLKDKFGRVTSGAGLYFPFTEDFGQLRLDVPVERENGSTAKYLTPVGAKAQARIPRGGQVITEGAKDAAAGSLLGRIPTGAIAGVSHYRKALKQGGGYTILFDSDGWENPSVFLNLFNAGKWLNGKIQLVPQIQGYPKAGLCEFFKSGHTPDDYKKLIESAAKPEALLIEWGNHFGDIPEKQLSYAIKVALRLTAEHLDEIEQDLLVANIKSNCKKVTAKTLSVELDKQKGIIAKLRKKEKNRTRQKQSDAFDDDFFEEDSHPEAFYRPICQAQDLKFDNCVTAQTFDGWVYRQEFGANEGNWRVLDAAFYNWNENLGYWQHRPDNQLNSLIANAGERAFKLKYSKEFGWQVVKPYETNAHKESAFKYCRSRLENPESLPANIHLRAFKNCVVDLRTGGRMPHSKDYGLTSIIPYDYEPGKECPEVFRQFIADSFGEDMLPIIRAFTSMFLDPTAPYGRFPHLIGQSGGGKGTMGRFWNSLFGEDGASSGNFSDIAEAEGRHQYLTGKSIFAIPDAGGFVSGLRAFYELVDNGGMSGRALFNPVGYFKTWNCRFWVASVDHLQIENAGDGWARRAYPIPVKARMVKSDPDLRLKLEACKADVISWALAMSREERDRVLLSPPDNERVINLTLDSALYGDSTKSFVDLCLRPTTETTPVPHHLLHTWYVAYCREHGYTPLGMSKFISHLKTVLPRNFFDRSWTPMVNGKRSKVSAHWEYLAPLTGAFVKGEVEIENDPFRGRTEKNNPAWTCIKAVCEEGGLMEFEDYWNSSFPPLNFSDNSRDTSPHPSPASDLSPPQNGGGVAQVVQGGPDFGESLKQRNSGGVQGGTGGQGIGFDLKKNQVATLERIEVESSITSVLGGGHPACKVDSCNIAQNESIQAELTSSTQTTLCDIESVEVSQAETSEAKPLTLAMLIELLKSVQVLSDLESVEREAHRSGLDEKEWKQEVWPHLDEDTQKWLKILDSHRLRPNPNLDFCLEALAVLEAPEHPTISSDDDLFALFHEIELRGETCGEDLPSDFWSRVSTALGTVAESLKIAEERQNGSNERYRVRVFGGTLQQSTLEWISDCLLESEPNPPCQNQWIFVTPDGQRLSIFDEEGFELESF